MSMSDRNVKTNLVSIDPQAVLAGVARLPMTTWQYKTEPGVRHVGPMAQDFYAAFNVGEDNRHIAEVDEGGVALAAIQGLNSQVQQLKKALAEKDAACTTLQQENQTMEQRLDALQKLVQQAMKQR